MITSQIRTKNVIPVVPGLPLLGNALTMAGDVQAFLVECYQRYGSVYQVRAINQVFTVLAGVEANCFLRDHGDQVLHSETTMGGLSQEFRMDVHGLRGPSHRHLRSILRRGLSGEQLFAQWDTLWQISDLFLGQWRTNQCIPVVETFQKLVTWQLSMALGNASSQPHFQPIKHVFETALEVKIARKYPAWFLHNPLYRRDKDRILRFIRNLIAQRRAEPSTSGQPDLIDVALSAIDENGEPYSEEAVIGMILQGYFGGLNTVAYLCSFALYALLKHPDIMERVQTEVDEAFASGHPQPEQIKDMKTLQNALLEALRLYPPAPASARVAAEDFEFAGYQIKAGTHLFFAVAVTHHLDQFFPQPMIFNIDRPELRRPHAQTFLPFSTGSHTCLGAQITPIHSAMVLAGLLHRWKMTLEPTHYSLRIQATPGPNPGNRFAVRLHQR